MAPGAQRPHRPHELGPRIYREKGSRWWRVDLRPWGRGRVAMRNPKDPGWPDVGERTEVEEIASRWAWDYLDLMRSEHVERVTGVVRKRERPLVSVIDEYFRHRVNTVTERTVANDRNVLGHLLEHLPGSMPVHRLTTDHAQAFLDSFTERGYKPYTVKTYGLILSSFYGWIGKPGLFQELTYPKRVGADARALTDEELDAVRTVASEMTPGFRRGVELAVATGLRRGELCALEWRDFRGDRSLRVSRQLDKRGRVQGLKGNRPRTALVLPGWWSHHDSRGEGRVLPELQSHDKWFKVTGRMFRRAGIYEKGMGVHVFRHTYARKFLEADGRLEELRLSMGHASITTTQRTYGHLTEDVAITMASGRIYGAGATRSGTSSGR